MRKQAALILLVSLCAHGLYLVARGWAVQADGTEYWRLAENLRHHQTFSLEVAFGPTIRRAPGYPFLIAATGSVTATILIQVVMSALMAAMVFLLACEVAPFWAALTMGLLYAVHPSSLYWTRMLHSETAFTFLSLAGLFALSRRSSVAGGLLLGGAALCRPVGAPFILVAAVMVAWGDWRRHVREALTVAIVGALVLVPWIIRSSRLAHRFVLLSATSTVNLYIGTQSGQPIYSDEWFQRFLREDPCGHGFNTARTPVESVAADDICTAGAKAAIKAHPGAYLLGRCRALIRLLTSSFDLTIGNQRSTSDLRAEGRWHLLALKAFLLLVFCAVPLLLALLGLRRSLRSHAGRLAAVFWLYTIAIFLPGYTEFRYFAPAVPALFVTSAMGLAGLLSLWQRDLRPRA